MKRCSDMVHSRTAANAQLSCGNWEPVHPFYKCLTFCGTRGNNVLAMSVIAAYASRISSARAGVWSKSRLMEHRPAPCICAFLVLALVLSPASWKCLSAESSAQPPVSPIEATNSREVLQACLKLQEQVHATQLAIEQNRREAKETAAQNAEAMAKGLQSMQEAFSAERARELEAMQRSSKVLLMVAGAFAVIGFLALLIMTYFQWRTSRSLAEISAGLPTALGFGPGSAVPALDPGGSRLGQGGLAPLATMANPPRPLTVTQRRRVRSRPGLMNVPALRSC